MKWNFEKCAEVTLYPIGPTNGSRHRFNMELDLQSLFGLLCTAVLIGWDPAIPPPLDPHWGSYTRALVVSQDRRHLFVIPWLTYYYCILPNVSEKFVFKLQYCFCLHVYGRYIEIQYLVCPYSSNNKVQFRRLPEGFHGVCRKTWASSPKRRSNFFYGGPLQMLLQSY